MKKIFLIVLCALSLLSGYAQNYVTLRIEDESFLNSTLSCCANNEWIETGIIILSEDNCNNNTWISSNSNICIGGENLDSIIIYNPHEFSSVNIEYYGCEINREFEIIFVAPFNPFDEPIIWKRTNDIITINANQYVQWPTGEITTSIDVSNPGNYTVNVSSVCGDTATYSVEVRDNVEIYRATCDLVTNKNQVTWHTTPEQAEYISNVKVYRNNELVGTVPYTDGVFTDNMGSENTQWQYHIVGVSVEGDDCPIPSYWKRTIHLDHVQGTQGDHILQWTPYEEESPTKSEVTAYRIFDVVDGVPTKVIDVGNFTNVYTYNPADFHGYGMVAAVFADEKGLEELAFSNLTKQMLEVGEHSTSIMNIYPNPSNGTVTVEGTGRLSVMNVLGQEILVQEIEGKTTLELPKGIYLMRLGSAIQKVVVE